jgi:hypothetical protein
MGFCIIMDFKNHPIEIPFWGKRGQDGHLNAFKSIYKVEYYIARI